MRRSTFIAVLCLVPLLLSPILARATTVTLQWDYSQNSDPAVGFNLYKQTAVSGVCTATFSKVNTALLPLTPLMYADSAVQVGTTYCWQVTSVDAKGGESVPSNTLIFPVLPPPQPAQPMNLRGTVSP